MIEQIQGLPKNVVGFKATGQITREDYAKVVIPAVQKAFEDDGNLNLFYEIDMGFTGVAFGAGWDDMSLGMNYLTRWDRVAFVSDIVWMVQMTKAIAFLMPSDVRTYSLEDKEKALAWVKGED